MECRHEQMMKNDLRFLMHPILDRNNNWHDYYEIVLVQKGEIEFFIEGERNTLYMKRGDMILIRPCVLHCAAKTGQEEALVYVFSFKNNSLPDMVQSFPFLKAENDRYNSVYTMSLPDEISTSVLTIARFISETFRDDTDGIHAPLQQYLAFLLGLFDEYGKCRETESCSEEESRQYIRIITACSYIEEHIGENIPAAKLAQIANYSTAHFFRLFRKIVGCSVKEYTDNIKIREAQRLLGQHSITEISYMLGYSHPNNLSRMYKRVTGRNLRKDKNAMK